MERPDTTPTDPTLFRVTSLEPFPVPSFSHPGWRVLEVEYLNHPAGDRRHAIDLPRDWYLPYQEATREAIQSQLVYWVEDLDYSKTPSFPIRPDDTVAHRLLKTLGNRQIVRDQE